ncbi:glycosyl hydrolase family 61-domain-containing protein [Cyathus striatus]|nr:glycosyl hydrolase family 61-domain-containing protein [Cyathus striatus]
MKLALSLLASAALANAHFTMQYIWVNGADQGQNNYIRVPPSNNPVTDVTSTDLTCNVNGLSGSSVSTVTIPAVSNGTNMPSALVKTPSQAATRDQFRSTSPRHLPLPLPLTAKAPSGPKIYSSGLVDPSTQEWATDVVNANNGKHSVVIPSSLSAGEYLLRAEIIALHVASTYPGAQFYMVKISSGGSASPPTIALPVTTRAPTPVSPYINIYNNLQSYTAPGGAVWSG